MEWGEKRSWENSIIDPKISKCREKRRDSGSIKGYPREEGKGQTKNTPSRRMGVINESFRVKLSRRNYIGEGGKRGTVGRIRYASKKNLDKTAAKEVHGKKTVIRDSTGL